MDEILTLYEHQYYVLIWKAVKEQKYETLEDNRRIIGKLMLEHPDYQYFWEIPYQFAQTELEEAIENEGINPDLHLTMESIIQDQIEKNDPPEIVEAYNTLLNIGKDQHNARHIIGRIYLEVIFEVGQNAKKNIRVDDNLYINQLKYLKEHPNKVIRKQQNTITKGY